MAYLLQYGGYMLPAGFAPLSDDWPKDVAEQEMPRMAGAVTQPMRPRARRLAIGGALLGQGAGGADALLTAADALRAALESQASGASAPLHFGRSDRAINAQLEDVRAEYAQGQASWYGAALWLTASFVAGDPYFYDGGGAVAVTLGTGAGAYTLTQSTTGGASPNAPAFAAWTIAVATGGAGAITLANAATGETATLSGTFTAGQTITLQRAYGVYNVQVNGISTAGLLSGVIPMLAPSANPVTVLASGGVAVGAVSATYAPRWLS